VPSKQLSESQIKILRNNNLPHFKNDTLEKYALGRLPDSRTASVEEHLLLCGACREKLSEVDAFIELLRLGAPKVMAVSGGA
jgi:anti-sigma factor RsiW